MQSEVVVTKVLAWALAISLCTDEDGAPGKRSESITGQKGVVGNVTEVGPLMRHNGPHIRTGSRFRLYPRPKSRKRYFPDSALDDKK